MSQSIAIPMFGAIMVMSISEQGKELIIQWRTASGEEDDEHFNEPHRAVERMREICNDACDGMISSFEKVAGMDLAEKKKLLNEMLGT